MPQLERRLVAILNADAVGYTRLMADDDVATVETITLHRDEMARLVAQHGGRIVDSPGDNLLAEFSSATQAVKCAVAIQRVLEARNASFPADRRMQFRVGVHLGEVMVDGQRIYGDGVNVAARLESLAEPGGVCVSQKLVDEVGGKLALGFEDLGEQSIKNYPRPVRAYRVRPDGAAAPRSAATKRGRARWLAPAVGGVLIALAVAFSSGLLPSLPQAPDSAAQPLEIRSLAVLPLTNLSGDPSQEYFTAGMTEALIADLAKIASLSVISRTSVMQYAGVRMPLPEIAAALGVDAVVEGSVMRASDSVRITVQLIDARRDRHLWSDSYERQLRDVLALQREVARAIAREVQLTLAPSEIARLATPPPVDPVAYEAYLKGVYFLGRQGASNHRRAVELLEQAVEADPDYAPAWAYLADAYT